VNKTPRGTAVTNTKAKHTTSLITKQLTSVPQNEATGFCQCKTFYNWKPKVKPTGKHDVFKNKKFCRVETVSQNSSTVATLLICFVIHF
jgi:hypothetical protein